MIGFIWPAGDHVVTVDGFLSTLTLVRRCKSGHGGGIYGRPKYAFSVDCYREVEGDDSRVVVAVGKREMAIYVKRCRRRWRKLVSCQCGYPL